MPPTKDAVQPAVVMTRQQSALDREKELAELRRDATRRQAENKPARSFTSYVVQAPGRDQLTIQAANENDAWARYCDKIKHWPSPKNRTVRKA